MVVVCEDHSLGRHVSQRSHRTDRSREKPEPGARRPGARLPGRARERGRPGSARRAGRRGPSARWPAWGGEAAPGVRGSAEGAESGRATPSPAGKRRAWGGRSGGLAGSGRASERAERARRRRGKAGETQRLRGVRPETPGWQETEGRKGSTRSGGCGGGLGDRGGATPRGVQLVESEGRSVSSAAAECREREGAGPA